MEDFYELNSTNHKPWKKILSVILAVIIGFGTIVTLTVGSSRLQDWLGIKSMLSAYASEIVDTEGAVAVDENAMLADNHTINLENKDGSNTVYLFSEPISFVDDNGNLKTKDISVKKQTDKKLKDNGYDYTNGQNDYRINFSKDSSKGIEAVIGNYSYSIIPYSDTKAEGTESSAEFLNEKFEVFQYENIYGEGTNLRFYPQLNGVKDEIVLNRNINQNSFSFELKTNNCTAKLNDDGTISIINNDDIVIQTFTAPFAYDSEYVEGDLNSHYVDCEYSLIDKDETSYIMTITVPNEWLTSDSTKYPVIIDPTTSQLGNYRDAGIYNKSTSASICYGKEATCCFGRASEYGYGRVLNQFTMPSEIKKGAVINSAYSWQRETTGRTTSTKVTPHMVTSAWYEGEVTWKTRPTYNSVTGTTRTISSKSTDDPDNKYWYKFNITNMVQKWADGTNTNYGFCFESSEETDGNYNWRAFTSRQYSSSAMRPYTVINYTNDTTAPTATINVSTTSWTNGSVVLSVSNAKDNNGGSGLNSSAYSFSTSASEYCWGTTTSKSFDLNTTVYISVRDAVGNIKTYTQKISNIDKTAPSVSSVTGNPTKWTMDKVTLTASSNDSESGIKDYSFSSTEGAYSWQSENTKTFSENQTVYIYSRDNAGNISSAQTVVIDKITDNPLYLSEPEFYEDNQLIGIFNPSNENMEYKIGEDGEWQKYIVPFAIPYGTENTVYVKYESADDIILNKKFKSKNEYIGIYKESNTDFSLSYKNISFDFTRSYNSLDKKWFFATDSNVTKLTDNVMLAVMPDSTEFNFVRTAEKIYTNEINGYTLTLNDNGYVVQVDGVNYVYGIDGKLISISNKYDDTITIERTISSIVIKDGAGRKYTIAIDSNGNVVSATDPANNVITYTYDNNLTKVVDQAGVILGQYSYTNGILTKSMDKTINYNSDGRVTSYEYDSGAYINYTYDDANKTISTESSVETTTSKTYNDALMVVSSTDEDGKKTDYTYDEYYRTATENIDGKTVTYTYDSKGNVLSEVSDDKDAENTYYTYDSKGNVIRHQTGNNYTYSVYNDNSELIISATLKENYYGEIPVVYDSSLTCFDTISYTYENGLLTKTIDIKTKETVTNIYDEYGNSVKITTVTEKEDGLVVGTVDNTYNIMGNLLTSVSDKETSSYIYDKAGRTLLSNEKGKCTRTIYDNLGRTIQEIGPEDYDSSKDGLPESNTYSDSKAGHTYQYSANGTLASETNRLGKTTKYFYNDIGSKIREEFDLYKFYYLNHGELYQVKVANTTTVLYSYDSKFNLVQETYANDDVVRYSYDDDGNLVYQYHNSNAKPYVTYTYIDGELTQKINTDTGLKYVYGENNKVDVYKTSDNTLVQSYIEKETEADEEKNITSQKDITETHFGKTYSSVVKDKSVSYTSVSDTIEYSYQTTGTDDNEKIIGDTVKHNGNNVLSSSYAYDDKDNITSKKCSYIEYGEDTSISFVNEYDEDGKITATGYDTVSTHYTYDENDQLVSVFGGNYYASYAYDGRGNITTKTINNETTNFTYANFGWKDLLVAVNDVEVSYDENGNPLSYGDREFTWNSGRQLESIVDGNDNYSYTYDENGIRTSKTVNGKTTYFNTKDGVILSQTDGTDTMYFQYNGSIPLGFIYNDTQYLYITNQMGDVIGITDENGNILIAYGYDEWGSNIYINTNDGDDGSLRALAEINPLRYRGYYYDNETGYYYLQSRYYDPNICRFINSDIPEIAQMSKGIPVGTNLFAYCNNNPVNNSDPNGEISIKSAFKTILNALKNRIGNYFRQLFSVKNGKIKISVSLFAVFIDSILSSLISRVVYNGVKELLKLTVKYRAKKAPQKVIDTIKTVITVMDTNGFFKLIGNMLIKRCLKLPTTVNSFVKNLKNNVLYSGLLSRSKILSKISLVTSMMSSVGGFIATIIDVMDKKWDGYLIFRVSRRKVILL